jgi:hypothetical protein
MNKAVVEFTDAIVEIEQTDKSGGDVAVLKRGPGRVLTVPWSETLMLSESVHRGCLLSMDGSKLTISLKLPHTTNMN